MINPGCADVLKPFKIEIFKGVMDVSASSSQPRWSKLLFLSGVCKKLICNCIPQPKGKGSISCMENPLIIA